MATQDEVLNTLLDQSVQIMELRRERIQLRDAIEGAATTIEQRDARIKELEGELSILRNQPGEADTADVAGEGPAEPEGG